MMSKKKSKGYKNGGSPKKKRLNYDSGGEATIKIGQNSSEDQYLVDESKDTYSKKRFLAGLSAMGSGAGGSNPVSMMASGTFSTIAAMYGMDEEAEAAKGRIKTNTRNNARLGTEMVSAGNLEDAKINTMAGTITHKDSGFQGRGSEVGDSPVYENNMNKDQQAGMGIISGGAVPLLGAAQGRENSPIDHGRAEGLDTNKLKSPFNMNDGGQVVAGTKSERGVDNIPFNAEDQSFIVPKENADIALMLRREYFPDSVGKKAPRQNGNVAINISDGEHYFSAEEYKTLKDNGVDVDRLAPNGHNVTPGVAANNGGPVNDTADGPTSFAKGGKVEYEGKEYDVSKLKKHDNIGWVYDDGSKNGKQLGRFNKFAEYLDKNVKVNESGVGVSYTPPQRGGATRPSVTGGDTQFERRLDLENVSASNPTGVKSNEGSSTKPASIFEQLYGKSPKDSEVSINVDQSLIGEIKKDPNAKPRNTSNLSPNERAIMKHQKDIAYINSGAYMHDQEKKEENEARIKAEKSASILSEKATPLGPKDAKISTSEDDRQIKGISGDPNQLPHNYEEGETERLSRHRIRTMPDDPNAEVEPEKEKGKFFKNFFSNSANTSSLIGAAQTGIGLAGILGKEERPEVTVDPGIAGMEAQAMNDAKTGFTPEEKQYVEAKIESNRIASNTNAVNKFAGGNRNTAMAIINMNNINADKATLAYKIADNDRKEEKKRYAHNVIQIASRDRRYVEANKLNQYDKELESYSSLLNTGLSNVIESGQLNEIKTRLNTLDTAS